MGACCGPWAANRRPAGCTSATSREGSLTLGIYAKTHSYFVTIQDGKLPSGKAVFALSFSKSAPVRQTSQPLVGPKVAHAGGQSGILVCSTIDWPDTIAGIGFHVHLCPQDVTIVEGVSILLVAAIVALIILQSPPAGVAAIVMGFFVSAAIIIGFERARNPDQSVDMHIPLGTWQSSSLTGPFSYGTGLVAHVNGDPCAITLDTGEVLRRCGYGSIFHWVGVNGRADLQAFVIDSSGNYFTINQTSPGGGWGGYTYLQGGMSGRAATGINIAGFMELIGINAFQHLIENFQLSSGPLNWAGTFDLGCCVKGVPAVAANYDGRLEIFALDANTQHINHVWEGTPGGAFNNYGDLGCCLGSDPVVGRNTDGRLEVFAVDPNQTLWHNWQTTPGGGWSGWYSLGCCVIGDPAVAVNGNGTLEVFERGTDGSVWHQWQWTPGGGWSGWYLLANGTVGSDVAMGINSDGRIEGVAIGNDFHMYHVRQTSPSGGWSSWSDLGCCVLGNPDLRSNYDGRLEAFAIGTSSDLVHFWQTSPGGGWSNLSSLGGAWRGV